MGNCFSATDTFCRSSTYATAPTLQVDMGGRFGVDYVRLTPVSGSRLGQWVKNYRIWVSDGSDFEEHGAVCVDETLSPTDPPLGLAHMVACHVDIFLKSASPPSRGSAASDASYDLSGKRKHTRGENDQANS